MSEVEVHLTANLIISYEEFHDLCERGRDVRAWCEENEMPMPLWNTVASDASVYYNSTPLIAAFRTANDAAAFKLRWL